MLTLFVTIVFAIIVSTIWWSAGTAILLHATHTIKSFITVRDVIVCSLYGWLGPVAILPWLIFADKPWLNTRIG
jgi:hypothetical protein